MGSRSTTKLKKDENIIIVPSPRINTLNSVCVKSFSIFIDNVRPWWYITVELCMLYQIQYLVGAKPLTRTQICLCFLQKERESFHRFKHFSAICHSLIYRRISANWRHWDLWYTTTWIAIGKFQYWMFPLTTILLRHSFVFLLKAPVQLPWSCYFLHYFLRYSAIILLSIAYNSSSQDGIIATWQISNENTKQPTNRWELGLTWWLFLSSCKSKT